MGPSSAGRFVTLCYRFAADEDGSITIWNITWLMVFVIMAGLAIDTTNARRVETIMASTADVAALAGVMELPMPHLTLPYSSAMELPIEVAAIDFAQQNMPVAQHGEYLKNSDIFVGNWNFETRDFTWGPQPDKPVNAVQVWLSRTQDKSNPLATLMLRTIGLTDLNLSTTTTAVASVPNCYQNGIVAEGRLNLASNNKIFSGVCLHGQGGIHINNNNWWWPDTTVSHGRGTDVFLGPTQNDSSGAAGLRPLVITQNQHPSAMVWDVLNVGRAMADLDGSWQATHGYNPDYERMRISDMQNADNGPVIELDEFTLSDTVQPSTYAGIHDVASFGGLSEVSHQKNGRVSRGGSDARNFGSGGAGVSGGGTSTACVSSDTDFLLQDMRAGFDQTTCPGPNLIEGRTYYAACDGKLIINGTIRNVVIISECHVQMKNDAKLENVMLVVLGTGPSNKSLDTSNNPVFGAADGCPGGGGFRGWFMGDVHTASTALFYDSQIYIGGNLHFGGKSDSRNGISAHVAGDAHLPAKAEVAGLSDETLPLAKGRPACAGAVRWDWILSDYQYSLVE